MATSKQTFQALTASIIQNYPNVAQLYQAGDPRVVATLDAQAAMLAMLSAEQDIAAAEPFTKARDVTVLADASIKGVLPFGKPAKVQIDVANGSSTTALSITTGRRLLDTQGRVYVVDMGATIATSGTGTITAIQQDDITIQHTVTATQSFYSIPIPDPQGARYTCKVSVTQVSTGIVFDYIPDFVNVAVDQKMFHIEVDEAQAMSIVFGAQGIAGYTPQAGEVFTVVVSENEGVISLQPTSPFAFEYSFIPVESTASLTFNSLLIPGSAPFDIATLRQITSYPSLYDGSAVYLGNFDFLVRRQLSPFRFLSIWNEQIEEAARGANIDHINRLFVAATADGVDPTTLQSRISDVINNADDSYRITYVTVVTHQIPVTIVATIASVYDFAVVEQQIRDIVAAYYGPDTVFAQRGRGRVQNKVLVNLLTGKVDGEPGVQALQDQHSDLQITITDPPGAILPEHYRYVSNASLTVTITTV